MLGPPFSFFLRMAPLVSGYSAWVVAIPPGWLFRLGGGFQGAQARWFIGSGATLLTLRAASGCLRPTIPVFQVVVAVVVVVVVVVMVVAGVCAVVLVFTGCSRCSAVRGFRVQKQPGSVFSPRRSQWAPVGFEPATFGAKVWRSPARPPG